MGKLSFETLCRGTPSCFRMLFEIGIEPIFTLMLSENAKGEYFAIEREVSVRRTSTYLSLHLGISDIEERSWDCFCQSFNIDFEHEGDLKRKPAILNFLVDDLPWNLKSESFNHRVPVSDILEAKENHDLDDIVFKPTTQNILSLYECDSEEAFVCWLKLTKSPLTSIIYLCRYAMGACLKTL